MSAQYCSSSSKQGAHSKIIPLPQPPLVVAHKTWVSLLLVKGMKDMQLLLLLRRPAAMALAAVQLLQSCKGS
jgi:hypothetical protein